MANYMAKCCLYVDCVVEKITEPIFTKLSLNMSTSPKYMHKEVFTFFTAILLTYNKLTIFQ